MSRASDDGYRESIWGIDPRDRPWFQLFTLVGGIVGSVILTWLELNYPSDGSTPSEVARNVVLGISASFVAAGFIVWGILQAKDLAMPAGDILRGFVERRRARWLEEGRRQGREEALREIYGPNYSNSREGSQSQPSDADNTKGGDRSDADK